MVLLTTCNGAVLLDTSVPLLGSPMMVWLVEVMVTVELSELAGADASGPCCASGSSRALG